jgi:CRP-like cAMP-binding protein
MTDAPLIAQVRAVLSEAEFVRLAEALGGSRVYVPRRLTDEHDLVAAIGRDAAERISAAIGTEWLVVPLAKRERALYWQAQNLKDHEIARKLGMTRSGVQKLLDREAASAAPSRKEHR